MEIHAILLNTRITVILSCQDGMSVVSCAALTCIAVASVTLCCIPYTSTHLSVLIYSSILIQHSLTVPEHTCQNTSSVLHSDSPASLRHHIIHILTSQQVTNWIYCLLISILLIVELEVEPQVFDLAFLKSRLRITGYWGSQTVK